MKDLTIAKPCSESWEGMQPNKTGAFCGSCAKNVIDFSQMTNDQIRRVLLENSRSGEICGRFRPSQMETLNAEFDAWQASQTRRMHSIFVFSLFVAFGLTLFSCSENQEARVKKVHEQAREVFVSAPEAPLQVKAPEKEQPRPQPVAVPEYPQIISIVEHRIAEPEITKEVQFVEDEVRWMGGAGYSVRYIEYLEAVVPQAEERDSLGRIIPAEFSALAYPNPTEGPCRLKMELPSGDRYGILLIDMNGRVLREIYSGQIERGFFETEADLTDFPSGTYVIAIRSKSWSQTVKVMKI
jgi:hypothetical protein